MSNFIAFVTSAESIQVGAVGMILGLVSVIFGSVITRISKLETKYETMLPTIYRIDANVKNIKEHCSHCMDGR